MIDGQIAGGVITETEAYKGTQDKGSHAYGGRRTKRNEMMYHAGGVAYVYRCYGMHCLLNLVTNVADVPDAILIRGIYPTHGCELMQRRRKQARITSLFTNGPAKVAQALGIQMEHNGIELDSSTLWLEDRAVKPIADEVVATARIGIDYAGEDARLPYRFVWQNASDVLKNR